MMPLPVQCPHCRATYQVADKFAGRKIRCPKCKEGVVSVPAPAAPIVDEDPLGGLNDVFSSGPALAPPPKRRSSAGKSSTGPLLIIGGVLLALVFMVGGLAVAGVYAWQYASGGSGGSGANGRTAENDNARRLSEIGSMQFRPEKYPILLRLPHGDIKAETVAGMDQFAWNGSSGKLAGSEIKLIVVPHSDSLRRDNSFSTKAIEAAKERVRPMPPDKSRVANVSERSIRVAGQQAFEVAFEMPALKSQDRIAYIYHSSAVYVLVWHSVDDALPKFHWNHLLSTVFLSGPTSSGGSHYPREVSTAGGGATPMRSKTHPFEIDFPTDRAIAFPTPKGKDAFVYLHRPESGVVHSKFLLLEHLNDPDATFLYVIYLPKKPGESAEAAIRQKIEMDKRDDDPAAFIEYKETTHDGYFAVDRCFTSRTPPDLKACGARLRTIGHPSGIYLISAYSKGANQAALDRFVESFRFTDGSAPSNNRSAPIPVADKAYAKNLSPKNEQGEPDPRGEYVLWDDIRAE